MTTYVLVPGACHGAWWYDDLADQLRSYGHRVLAITPTGVAERAHLLHAGVNLETHIADVMAELAAHNVEQAVLVGHSYGGMVITAVADRASERVDALVYLDAFVPEDGDSCWTLTTDEPAAVVHQRRRHRLRHAPASVLRRARDRASAGVVDAANPAGRRPVPVPAPRLRVCDEVGRRIAARGNLRAGAQPPVVDDACAGQRPQPNA